MRWGILAVGVFSFLAGAAWILTPWIWGDLLGFDAAGLAGTPALVYLGDPDWTYYIEAAVFLGVFLLTQWFFLRPRGTWAVSLQDRGRPMLLASVGAAFGFMLVSAGLVASFLEIADRWVFDDGYAWPVYVVMLGLWAGWAAVFYVYWRAGDRYTRLTKMIRALVGGSILELMVATPVHVLCEDKDDCYCVRGSYTGLVFGGAALIWAFGPGIVLLFLREHHRRAKLLRK